MLQRDRIALLRHDAAALHEPLAETQVPEFARAPQEQVLDDAAEAREQLPHAHRHHQARTPDYDFDSGESLIVFAARVMRGLDALAERHPGQNLLAFTHGGVLDIAYRAAMSRALDAPRDFTLPNAALNWLERDERGWRLISWADCRHLPGVLDEVPG